jgi:hypothetical protein
MQQSIASDGVPSTLGNAAGITFGDGDDFGEGGVSSLG